MSPSLQIQGLQPDTEYELRVAALVPGSGSGSGRPSAPLLLRTQPERTVPAAPGRLRLTALGATRLLASWEPVSPPPDWYTLYVAQVRRRGGWEVESRIVNYSESNHDSIHNALIFA